MKPRRTPGLPPARHLGTATRPTPAILPDRVPRPSIGRSGIACFPARWRTGTRRLALPESAAMSGIGCWPTASAGTSCGVRTGLGPRLRCASSPCASGSPICATTRTMPASAMARAPHGDPGTTVGVPRSPRGTWGPADPSRVPKDGRGGSRAPPAAPGALPPPRAPSLHRCPLRHAVRLPRDRRGTGDHDARTVVGRGQGAGSARTRGPTARGPAPTDMAFRIRALHHPRNMAYTPRGGTHLERGRHGTRRSPCA